jgi:hypothetical protein
MNVTRDVISDLWPTYAAGEASADTRTLVEEFLKSDPDFARLLQGNEAEALLKASPPALPPDGEARAMKKTQRILDGWDWSMILQLLAMSFTAQAFGRIIADTSWDVSPRNFIITVLIAAVFWCAFLVRRRWVRGKFYQKRDGGGA